MNQKGFSLLEVMIGVAILAVMSLLLYSIMNSSLTGKTRVERKEEDQHAVRIAMSRMVRDLNQAFLASANFEGVTNKYKTGMKGNKETLDFSTFSHLHFIRDQKDTDQVTVGYSLRKNDAGFNDLLRREAPHLGEKIDEGGLALALLENVMELKFTYYHPDKEEWVEEWDTASISSLKKLPKAVKIEMKIAYKENPDSDEKPKELDYSTVASVGLSKNEVSF